VRRKFLVVTVKKWLKSVHIYRSYHQNKPVGPFFMEHPVQATVSTQQGAESRTCGDFLESTPPVIQQC